MAKRETPLDGSPRFRARCEVMRAGLAVVVTSLLLASACTERVVLLSGVGERDAGRAPSDGSGAPDRSSPGESLPDGPGPDPDARCAPLLQNLRLEFESPEVVIALDRSSSMFAHRPGEKSWSELVRAQLIDYIRKNEGAIQFGYEEFPNRGPCDQAIGCCGSRVLVPPFLNSHPVIERQFRCDGPPGLCLFSGPDSPSGNALGRIRTFYDAEPDPAQDRFVLLITDGDPSCAKDPGECDDAGRQAARLFSLGGIRTIVLAVGEETKGSACLDAVAAMGQSRGTSSDPYSWVGDPAQLGDQLARAMSPVEARACRFLVRGDIKNRSAVTVTANFAALPRDPSHQEGWDFDASGAPVIQIFGSVCKELKSSQLEHRTVKAQQSCGPCASPSSICP